ncbi:uncharacterized protein LOC141649651 [Silene latifolia]|uniref:uncharacterized protein LOC141649651 n=1 Tax=Silene latifolia TaxID=37657 RepID=UPI003D77333F
MGLVWNCRGLNNTLSPTIPKLRALQGSKCFDFLFLIETKCNASSIFPMFRSYGFMKHFGVDAVGASGGLLVGWKKEARMSLVMACKNFIILLVEKYNGLLWYLVLFYGAPSSHLRIPVLLELEKWMDNCNYPFLIVGDFNQVDMECDKVNKSQGPIRGANFFNIWKIRNELIDIPFKGPRFTWCNNRKGDERVYETIDKALGSRDWLSFFPDSGIKHYPIQISDHAPIERDVGSPSFQVVRKLTRVRSTVKKWAFDKRDEWMGKWDDFDKRLEEGMKIAIAGEGDEMCAKVKGRAGRNYIHGIKGTNGDWIYKPDRIGNEFQCTFKRLYKEDANLGESSDVHDYDSILQHVKKVVPQDKNDFLKKPFTAKENQMRFLGSSTAEIRVPGEYGGSNYELCFNVLAATVENATEVGKIRGIRLCRGVKPLSHLFFAVDSIFFLHDKDDAASHLKSIMDKYCEASGQVLNSDKSGSLFSPSTTLAKGKRTMEIFGVRKCTGIGKYLAGRLTLISSVLSNLSNYFLSVFKIPVSVARKINSILSQFWWAGCKLGKKVHWCSKNFLSMPKCKGGLGIRNVECLNKALLAKHGWRLISGDKSYFGKVFRKKIFGKDEFKEGVYPISRNSASWRERSIKYGLELIMEKIGWKPGVESNLNIWNENWVNGLRPEPMDCILEPRFIHMGDLRIKDLLSPDGNWNAPLINLLFKDDWAKQILATPVCRSRTKDEVFWPLTDDESYTVKSGYGIVFEEYVPGE